MIVFRFYLHFGFSRYIKCNSVIIIIVVVVVVVVVVITHFLKGRVM